MINNTKIEICIGNIDDAIIASQYPIDRIELNSALELGGCTPTINTIKTLKKRITTPICCMDRPRGGDFTYTQLEFETMLKDAKDMLEAGADGIVFGFVRDKKINVEWTKQMVELIHSYHKEAVFHKAFDEVEDLEEGIQTLIACKVDRILTAGGCTPDKILEGCQIIGQLQEKYGDQIQLLPGGGVRTHNIVDVVNTAKSHQVHMTSKKTQNGYTLLDEQQLQELLKRLG